MKGNCRESDESHAAAERALVGLQGLGSKRPGTGKQPSETGRSLNDQRADAGLDLHDAGRTPWLDLQSGGTPRRGDREGADHRPLEDQWPASSLSARTTAPATAVRVVRRGRLPPALPGQRSSRLQGPRLPGPSTGPRGPAAMNHRVTQSPELRRRFRRHLPDHSCKGWLFSPIDSTSGHWTI